MEILNNIWMALSTPNEGLINCLSLPILLIEGYLALLLFSSILGLRLTIKQQIIYVLVISSEAFITMNYLPAPYNTFVNYIFTFILIYKLLKLNWIKSIFASILPSMFFRSNRYANF